MNSTIQPCSFSFTSPSPLSRPLFHCVSRPSFLALCIVLLLRDCLLACFHCFTFSLSYFINFFYLSSFPFVPIACFLFSTLLYSTYSYPILCDLTSSFHYYYSITLMKAVATRQRRQGRPGLSSKIFYYKSSQVALECTKLLNPSDQNIKYFRNTG